MRKIIIGLTTFLVAMLVMTGVAKAISTPFPPWLSQIYGDFTISDNGRTTVISSTNLTDSGSFLDRTAHAYYNFSVNGGGTVATPIDLGVSLPANAILVKSWYSVKTTLASPTTNLVGVFCEDSPGGAMNVIASQQVGGFSSGLIADGIETGSSANMRQEINSICNLKLYVSTHALTAGKMDIWVNYVASTN